MSGQDQTYLKEESYYMDLYDLGTIEECLSRIKFWDAASFEKLRNKMVEEEFATSFSPALKIDLYRIKGERYRRRNSIIREWMDDDRSRDELFRNAKEPRDVRCSDCAMAMSITLKDLYPVSEEIGRVIFFFECSLCKKRKGIFGNGESFVSKPALCPKCTAAIKVKCSENGKILIWLRSCSSCDFNETEIDDFEKIEIEKANTKQRNKEMLKKYRAEFCLSTAKGEEYLEGVRRLERFFGILEAAELKRADPDYKKVKNLKKWTIVELEKRLTTAALEKGQYLKLNLEKPEIGMCIIVSFITQDFDSSRNEKDSARKLQKIIKKTLVNSNWRLMSEGVSYRLGYLSGRLKGYEREEDLVQLIKKEKSQKETARIKRLRAVPKIICNTSEYNDL